MGKPRTKREPVVAESLAIEAPVARVWAALTSRHDLAQIVFGKVEMAATPGAAFSWQWGVWGFTWQGRVLDSVPGSTLVLGPKPVVTLTVKGEGADTLVTVTQFVPEGSGPGRKKLADYEYGWADFLLKLKTLLETESARNEVLVRHLMRATPAQVYRAWLSPRTLAKLIPGKAKVAARVGKRFAWQHKLSKHVHQGTFLELERNRTIAFTWEATQPASEVRIGMNAAPYGTLVAVRHTALLGLNPGQLYAQRTYWNRLLERLRYILYFKGRIRLP